MRHLYDINVKTTSALVLETKYSFVSLVTNLNNKKKMFVNSDMSISFPRNDFWDNLGGQVLVNSYLEYQQTIITNACPPKQSQKSLRPMVVTIIPTVFLKWGILGL